MAQGTGGWSSNLGAGIRRCKGLGVLPVFELRRMKAVEIASGAALLDDDGIELETAVDFEDLVQFFKAKEPFPAASRKRQRSPLSVVGIEARGR
ncbi:hypothetical protein [Syntrophus sp. (in: bacteria)]|uniref:hypothetical protein n=1 Tax=Syntrophus sp. (in: bacteria) TaxID=48412 RepID=UPI00345E8A9A